MDSARLKAAIQNELHGNLLPFWRVRCVDPRDGEFIAEMGNDGQVVVGAARGLVLSCRLLWTYAALYRRFADQHDLTLARRAFDDLEGRFRDQVHGGYRWSVGADSNEGEAVKKSYGQAFAIYAFSELFLATDDDALARVPLRPQIVRVHMVHAPLHGQRRPLL